MEIAAQGITAPAAVYEIGGRRFEIGSRGFAEAIADAHAAHQRPRCLCLAEGVEMYVARLGEGYIVKRMPDTGSRHAPDCPSYEPPAEFSGLGQVLGSAITEDPATGETTLKLDFPLAKMPGRSIMPSAGSESDSVSSSGNRLSLRGLLHYLWDQAELTRWHPGFEGKRSWGTVRKHLLQAAANKLAGRESLLSRLYIPEPFSVDQRDAINERRLAQWSRAVAHPRGSRPLLLLVAEVKDIMPGRYGSKAVIKHLPDQAFGLDDQLNRRLRHRFAKELELWASTDSLHTVMIATFHVSPAGLPFIDAASLMVLTKEWIPIEDVYEAHLVRVLLAARRSFVKSLRYNLPSNSISIFGTLLDTAEGPMQMLIDSHVDAEGLKQSMSNHDPAAAWTWHTSSSSPPELPAAVGRA